MHTPAMQDKVQDNRGITKGASQLGVPQNILMP